MNQVSWALDYFHTDHRRWMKELEFARQEILYFEHRLEDMVNRMQDRQMLQELEQFQNRFIREHEVMDELRHLVKQQEHNLAQTIQTDDLTMENFDLDAHLVLGEKMVSFAKLNSELRHAFNKFLLKQLPVVAAA